jgi:sodium/bile acid cotransporter 7
MVFISLGAIQACNRGPTEHKSDGNTELSDAEKCTAIEQMASKYHTEYADLPELSVSALADLMSHENVLLVDVRTPLEQEVSMIPGAVSKGEFEKSKEEHRKQTLVTYCTVGYRSGLYARELQKEGFHVFNLRGSVLAWTHAGRPMVDSKGVETRRVHVYGAEWNLLPHGYTPVW